MSFPRPAAAAAVSLALVFALTACGRSDAPSGPAESGAPIDDSPASGQIDVWAMGTEGELLPELVQQFEADNPDATVRVTAVPWQDYANKIQTAIASGATPDATMIGASDVASFAATGGLEPVPEGLADTSDVYPGAVEASMYSDQAYAVPWYVETRSLFYRKDLAQAAGVEAPKTWNEFLSFAEAMQTGGGAEWGYSIFTGATGTWNYALPYFWQAGASLLSEDGGSYRFDSPEALEGMEYYASLFESGVADPNGPVTLGEVEPKFVSGEVASFVSGPWEIGLLEDAGGSEFLDESVGIVPLPAGPKSNAGSIGGGSWSVFQDADNRDGAWKFVRWLGEQSSQESWFDISGDLPARQDAWATGALADDPYLAVFREQLESATPAPPTTTWVQVSAVVDKEFEKVAKGQSSPEDALKTIQTQADKIGTGQ
ncbi:sugar ABC transporter substrate-binding protein [Mycetocola zhujimingii]|uniref:ABC transporter substrate-binding protein n=1 Tax=Mycetocola zhujimingii TaxID=2079792 RepID=A0A2U1THH6_9MICO|nr:sugar ABC transporter substrate-binding protein [Mycetocola zhujimingii]PWC08341.1 ABC transporter substrate-binding protein [Mycetocola zhujimingii]